MTKLGTVVYIPNYELNNTYQKNVHQKATD